MTDYIYGVALNGIDPVPRKYKVLQETPARYIIDRPERNFVRKVTMIDRWESYFLDEAAAKAFLDSLVRTIEKRMRRFDYRHVYDLLMEAKTCDFDSTKLDEAIEYVKEFI